MVVESLVLAREDGLAEILGDLAQRHDRAFLAVNSADFLVEAVADDRALGHLTNAFEIEAPGTRAIDQHEEQQAVERGHQRITRNSQQIPLHPAEGAGEQVEQVERPEQQQRYRAGAARPFGGRLIAAAVGFFRRFWFRHRQAQVTAPYGGRHA
ncbi:MAG: hypothetical protein MUF86_06450, partial [Akkermansiaceae bacterium]|nr:hypothetical protein [Akkermansiaceae bacterium]